MQFLAPILVIMFFAATCCAQVTAFTDEAQWQQAAGSYTTLTFTDLPNFTIVTDQYAEQGIVLTDGNDFIHMTGSFPSDGFGLDSTDGFGNLGMIHMSFAEPQYWIALEFLGNVQLEFYAHGQLFFTSSNYVADFTPFVGFVSATPFDAVIILDNDDPTVAIDNIYFGPPIPAPGAAALFALAVSATLRRRKRSCCS